MKNLREPSISPEALLAEVEDVIRMMPSRDSMGNYDPDTLAWIGRASSIAHESNMLRATAMFDKHAMDLGSTNSRMYDAAFRGIVTMLHHIRSELRLRLGAPTSVAIPAGGVFDYFDEIRKVISEARSDLFFVDPYLDSEFVSRYLPHVVAGTTVRLLGRERMPKLVPAAELLHQQSGLSIAVRSAESFHDRYFFVDGRSCYQSGASFKDGAKRTPTTLTQITDAFDAVSGTYEALWSGGTTHV
jgi:hypothetical protein